VTKTNEDFFFKEKDILHIF